ncbi:uncharacterized protein TNCV_893031 [Trichonephila clavipes]|nr:uncharacterized protein TNCV_893031 [Trichonephila clavipes]
MRRCSWVWGKRTPNHRRSGQSSNFFTDMAYGTWCPRSHFPTCHHGADSRLEKEADDLNLKNEILVRLQRLEGLIVDSERLDAEESEIADFEKRYFNLKVQLKDKLDAIDTSDSNNVSGKNISIAIPTEQSNANFRLPKLNIPVFSDEPASLIKHIPLSNESYEEAWGKLIDRYDKKKQIAYALSKTFLDQKGISQVNMTNLRNLVDTSDEVLKGLKALGTEATETLG